MSRPGPAFYGQSRRGSTRRHNEDRFMVHRTATGLVAAVADGVGGCSRGGLAATLAMRSLRNIDQERDARDALVSRALAADLDIRAARALVDPGERMCTTLTALYLVGGRAVFVHAGDSRLYLLRGARASALTSDHTVLQPYLASGEMSLAQARLHPERNTLRQCLGCPMLEPDSGELDLSPGDTLVLCTDGLHGALEPDRLLHHLGGDAPLRAGTKALAQEAATLDDRDDTTLLALRP